MDKFNVKMTANCSVCGKEINIEQDPHFVLSDITSKTEAVWICANCAETITPMDLYLSGKIAMANSPDNAIEASAVVLDSDEPITEANGWSYMGTVPMSDEETEKFFSSTEPVFTDADV